MQYAAIIVGALCAISAVTVASAGEPDRRSRDSVQIDMLSADALEQLPYRCECEFYREPMSGATTIFATRQERTVGLVERNGRLVTLRRDGKPTNPICRKNARYRERWVGDSTVVDISQRATGSGAEACWYKGTMTVTVGGRRASEAVIGACGC